ncbi:MAG: hypothetical protein IKJ13_05815 [Clostridia bacterium]|nr:hypothetical protein [Clostridia bacterium]
MLIFLQEFVLQLFLWLLRMIDGLMEIFSAITGIATVNYNGKQVNLIEFVVGDSTVGTIFWCVFILSVGLTCIFTIASLIRNMINNQRTVVSIIGKFFLALLGTMAMLGVVVLGILIANSILQMIAEIFEIGNTAKISNALFNACAGEWINGYSVSEVDVASSSVSDIFGEYDTALFGIWPTSWKNTGMVDPDKFLYLPSLIAGVALAIALIIAVINLCKRIYEIVFMYLVMPISMSTLPLDDGARVKIWRETFISKIVSAYGAVFSVNIFVLVLPMITKMKLNGVGGFGNSMFLIFMIVGGAMLIPAGMNLFARLFGTAEDMHAGGNLLRSAFYGGRAATALSIGAAAKLIGGSFGLGKKIFAKKDKEKDKNGGNDESDKYSEDKGSSTSTDEGGTSE